MPAVSTLCEQPSSTRAPASPRNSCWRAVLIAAVSALSACSADGTTQPSQSIDGVYALRSVNGGAIPYTIPGTTSTYTGSTLTVSADGTWRELGTARIVENGQTRTASYDDRGTWTKSDTTLRFRATTGSPGYTGTASSARLLLNDGRYAFVFTK